MLALTLADLERLYEQHPEFNIVSRKLLQQYYSDAEGRAFIARLTNAETKYKQFLIRYSHFANRIPLTYIASFLGITLETLSRVRRKLSTKKIWPASSNKCSYPCGSISIPEFFGCTCFFLFKDGIEIRHVIKATFISNFIYTLRWDYVMNTAEDGLRSATSVKTLKQIIENNLKNRKEIKESVQTEKRVQV